MSFDKMIHVVDELEISCQAVIVQTQFLFMLKSKNCVWTSVLETVTSWRHSRRRIFVIVLT